MNGVTTKNRCKVKGEGNPIVLAHGMGGPIVWEQIIDKLAEYFMVIVPTFPGYLESDGIIQYTDQLYVDFLEEIRISMGLKELSLAGLSMGGRTVVNYTLQYPDYVKKLIIIDSSALNDMGIVFKLPIIKSIFPYLLKLILKNPKNIMKLNSDDFVDKENDVFKQSVKSFTEMIKSDIVRTNFSKIMGKIGLANKDWKEKLPTMDKPTLILWASEDKTAPVKWSYELQSAIKNSKLSILDKYGHMAIMEKPDFFIDQILDFLNTDR